MQSKLFDSELKVMGVLWREGDCTAKHISDVLKQEVGWNMNTTYTLIKRCIGKGAIQRTGTCAAANSSTSDCNMAMPSASAGGRSAPMTRSPRPKCCT